MSADFAIYTDDITIWTEEREHSSTSDTLVELQAAVNSLETCIPKLRLELTPEKTEIIIVSSTTQAHSTDPALLHIGDTTIQATRGHIGLLGLQPGSCNSPKIWVNQPKK